MMRHDPRRRGTSRPRMMPTGRARRVRGAGVVASGRSSGGTTPSPAGAAKAQAKPQRRKSKSRDRGRRFGCGRGDLLKFALCWRRSLESGRNNRQADGGDGGRTESGPPAGKRKPATGRVAGWRPGKGRGWRRILFASKYPASKIYKTKTLSYQDLSTFPLTASIRFS